MKHRIKEIKDISKKYQVDYDKVMQMYYKLHYETYLEANKTKDFKQLYDKNLNNILYSKIEKILGESK